MSRWQGLTVAILASGPSMNAAVAERARIAADRTIAINNTYELAPWADVLYACDARWWDVHFAQAEGRMGRAEFWTQDEEAVNRYPVQLMRSKALPGLSFEPNLIHQGGNSGYQALGLAHQFGARRILLFGYDMGEQVHWHGHHEGALNERMPFEEWIPRFDQLAEDLKRVGVEVLNCNPESRLRAFEFAEMAQRA